MLCHWSETVGSSQKGHVRKGSPSFLCRGSKTQSDTGLARLASCCHSRLRLSGRRVAAKEAQRRMLCSAGQARLGLPCLAPGLCVRRTTTRIFSVGALISVSVLSSNFGLTLDCQSLTVEPQLWSALFWRTFACRQDLTSGNWQKQFAIPAKSLSQLFWPDYTRFSFPYHPLQASPWFTIETDEPGSTESYSVPVQSSFGL